MNILALDLSLTATGVCHPDGSTETIKSKARGMTRLRDIRDAVCEAVDPTDGPVVDLVVVEGYSFGSRGRAAVSLGELGGVIRLSLWEWGTPYVEIPPSCRAKYATGRGNAGKDDVLQAGVMRSGHTFRDNNACDAWWLHQLALAHYAPDSPLLVPVPKAHLEALSKIAWVDVRKKAA